MKNHLILTSIASILLFSSHSILAQNKKMEDNQISSSVISSSKNAVLIEGYSYHINQSQPLPLSNDDVNSQLSNTNDYLLFSLNSNLTQLPVEYFNFKNLPGIDGQIHALWLRNDFSEAANRTFNITGNNVNNLKIAIPSQFKSQNSKQCDVIFISYQLKDSLSPSNLIRFAKIKKEDEKDVIKLYNDIPKDCHFQSIDKDKNAFSSKSGYIVNFGFNPKTMSKENILDLTLHASKEGKEHFLPDLETVIIKNDLSSLNFIVPSEPTFKKSVISAFYGSKYSANITDSGKYFVGIGFGSGKNREWLFTSTEIK